MPRWKRERYMDASGAWRAPNDDYIDESGAWRRDLIKYRVRAIYVYVLNKLDILNSGLVVFTIIKQESLVCDTIIETKIG